MRARSAKQRFPVAKWVEDLGALQSASIRIHQSELGSSKANRRSGSGVSNLQVDLLSTRNVSSDRLSMYEERTTTEEDSFNAGQNAGQSGSLGRTLSLGKRTGPGRAQASSDDLVRLSRVGEEQEDEAEVEISSEEANRLFREEGAIQAPGPATLDVPRTRGRPANPRLDTDDLDGRGRSRSRGAPDVSLFSPGGSQSQPAENFPPREDRTRSPSPAARDSLLPADARRSVSSHRLSSASQLSLTDVTHGRKDYNLQKVELNFTDSTGEFHDKFEAMLQEKLNAKTSESTLVIDDYLKLSEKEWATRYREAKLGRSKSPGVSDPRRYSQDGRPSYDRRRSSGMDSRRNSSSSDAASNAGSVMDEFLLGEHYVKPSILKRWLQTRIFDWPIYSRCPPVLL